MRSISFILTGIFFGIVLTKGEIISWFRIQEMFRFESFHMYGVIGSAVILGILMNILMKRSGMKSVQDKEIQFAVKPGGFWNYILGGTFFGLGWAMTGACPGPMYILFGSGYSVFLVVIISAILGAFVYGITKRSLPH
jgi:uncharacterized membrane protein YedE/YeeE